MTKEQLLRAAEVQILRGYVAPALAHALYDGNLDFPTHPVIKGWGSDIPSKLESQREGPLLVVSSSRMALSQITIFVRLSQH